jgi:site-specific recombinase XerD
VTCVLDIRPVVGDLWAAANAWCGEASQAGKHWVHQQLTAILRGRVGDVIGGLRQILTKPRLRTSGQFLRADEYTKMLSLAGVNPRDYAILQVFLQTGIRVSELAHLTLEDVDLIKPAIQVRGKGSIEREIALEKRGLLALKNYLAVRPESLSSVLFLNYKGEPISERGIRKLVVKYRKNAGITKRASCHSLRHTFATYKAEKGVSPFQLQQWLGHANLNTTQIYVHLGKQNAKKIMDQTSLS